MEIDHSESMFVACALIEEDSITCLLVSKSIINRRFGFTRFSLLSLEWGPFVDVSHVFHGVDPLLIDMWKKRRKADSPSPFRVLIKMDQNPFIVMTIELNSSSIVIMSSQSLATPEQLVLYASTSSDFGTCLVDKSATNCPVYVWDKKGMLMRWTKNDEAQQWMSSVVLKLTQIKIDDIRGFASTESSLVFVNVKGGMIDKFVLISKVYVAVRELGVGDLSTLPFLRPIVDGLVVFCLQTKENEEVYTCLSTQSAGFLKKDVKEEFGLLKCRSHEFFQSTDGHRAVLFDTRGLIHLMYLQVPRLAEVSMAALPAYVRERGQPVEEMGRIAISPPIPATLRDQRYTF